MLVATDVYLSRLDSKHTAVDLVGLLVGDLDAELLLVQLSETCTVPVFSEEKNSSTYLFDGHHHLDGVQAVKTEIVGEVRNAVDLMSRTC